MTKKMNKACRQFLGEVNKALSCSWNMKIVIMREIRAQLMEFANQVEGEITAEQLTEHLGAAEQVGKGYFDKADLEWLKKRSKQVLWWRVATGVLVVLLVIAIAFIIHLWESRGPNIFVYSSNF